MSYIGETDKLATSQNLRSNKKCLFQFLQDLIIDA